MRAPRGGHCPLPVCVPRTLSSTGTDVWAHGGVRATLLFDPDGHVGRVSFCTSLTAPLSGREHRTPSFFPVAPQHPQMHADVFSRTPTDQPLGCFSFLPLTGHAVGSILTRVSWLTCQSGWDTLRARRGIATAGGPSAEVTGTLPAPEPEQICSLHSPSTGCCQPCFISDKM